MVRRLLLLNGLAILGVVFFHASGWGFTALLAWRGRWEALANADPLAGSAYYYLRLVEQLVVFCIPAFLFVSGYFIAFAVSRVQRTIGWGTIWARIQSLLIPYLLWSCGLLFLQLLEGRVHSPIRYLEILATGKANEAYYYVILLLQFYLLAPILAPLARFRWALLLIATGLLQLTVQLAYYPVLLGIQPPILETYVDVVPKWAFPARIFWFSLGMVAGFQLSAFKSFAHRFRWAALTVASASFVIGVLEWELYFHLSGLAFLGHRETLVDNFYCAAVLLSFIGFQKFEPPLSGALNYLGSRSFGIYLAHAPAMELTARAIYHAAPLLLAYQMVMQPLLILVGLGLSLALMAAVKRSRLRVFYAQIFG